MKDRGKRKKKWDGCQREPSATGHEIWQNNYL